MNRPGLLTPAAAALISLLCMPVAIAGDLTVSVVGLESDKGDVHIALYDKPDQFPDSDGMLFEEKVPVSARQARIVFRNLEPGKYAIAVYHDENANHEFDQGFLGIPLEDYGFSAGARAFLGPPTFEEAGFEVPEDNSSSVIDLGN